MRGKGKKALAWDEVEVGPVATFANERADFTFRLSDLLTPRMHEGEFERLFYEIELPLAGVLATMELNGIKVATQPLEALAEEATAELERLRALCTELAQPVLRSTHQQHKQCHVWLACHCKAPCRVREVLPTELAHPLPRCHRQHQIECRI